MAVFKLFHVNVPILIEVVCYFSGCARIRLCFVVCHKIELIGHGVWQSGAPPHTPNQCPPLGPQRTIPSSHVHDSTQRWRVETFSNFMTSLMHEWVVQLQVRALQAGPPIGSAQGGRGVCVMTRRETNKSLS